MADDTDALFGLILFILFLALLGYAAGGISSSPSTAGTTSGTYQSLPPMAGSSVSACPDRYTLEQDEPGGTTNLNLTVYVDPMDAGQKCATASTTSGGTLKVTLAYTADKSQNVSNTNQCGSPGQTCTASVQVNGTADYCVSAAAAIVGTCEQVTIPKVVEPCRMTAPAMHPADPGPGLPAHPDDIEDEEGY